MDFEKLNPLVQFAALVGVAIATALAALFGKRMKSSGSGDDDEFKRLKKELEDANFREAMRVQRETILTEVTDREQERATQVADLYTELNKLRDRVTILENRRGGR